MFNSRKIQNMRDQLERWQSLPRLKASRTRLLCHECGEMRACVDFRPLSKVTVLECQHTRTVEIDLSPEAVTEFKKWLAL